MARSINQNAYSSALPNFRNLGVLLRILVVVNVIALAAAIIKTTELNAMWQELLEISALVQPLLILSLLTLVVVNDWLRRLPDQVGVIAVIVIEIAITALLYHLGRPLLAAEPAPLTRYMLLVLLVTATLLKYFQLRNRSFRPRSWRRGYRRCKRRIRLISVHSINAVLSVIGRIRSGRRGGAEWPLSSGG